MTRSSQRKLFALPHCIFSFCLKAILLNGLAAVIGLAGIACAEEKLPWESNLAVAREKAFREDRPLFIMMTATWCGPCKALEQETLPNKLILDGLKEFVWVQAFEEKEVEKKYSCTGYPTLVFVDPKSEKVLYRTSGYEKVGPFLKHVIAARKKTGLALNQAMEKLSSKSFQPDFKLLGELIENSDAIGIKKHLEPVDEDQLRNSNYIVGKVILPENVRMSEVLIPSLTDRPISDTGLFVLPVNRDLPKLPVTVLAPDCKSVTHTLRFTDRKGVIFQKFELSKLTKKDAVEFLGKVTRPDGRPIADAIVRICDWDVMRTDSSGNFRFELVPHGEFLVRAEYPGGEFHQNVKFGDTRKKQMDLRLSPVTTVGIRWSLQMDPGVRKLVGERVQQGEAYFSVRNSRFSLSRGAVVRSSFGSDFMLRDNASKETSGSPSSQSQVSASSIVFHCFDKSEHNGLHQENRKFDEIVEISEEAIAKQGQYFTMIRNLKVQAGMVLTVRCCLVDRYAKLEILRVDPPMN